MEDPKNQISKPNKVPTGGKILEGVHYCINENGLWVFTEEYHLLRGYCCDHGCKHCPYGNAKGTS